ncbi:hypothetical protein TELCIR_09358, partial [Teladorsagia circumcincta]
MMNFLRIAVFLVLLAGAPAAKMKLSILLVIVMVDLATSIYDCKTPCKKCKNEIGALIFAKDYETKTRKIQPILKEYCKDKCMAVFCENTMKTLKELEKRSPRTVINWDHFTSLVSVWEDSVIENIDEEYYRLVEHLHDSGRKAESLEVTKGRLSPKTLELMRQRGAARAAGNHEITSELAKLCREAIKEDLKERRAAVLAEAAEAGRSIRNARRSFASYKTKMTCLRRLYGTVTTSRRAMEKVIHDSHSDLFDSHVHLPTYQLQQDGYVVPSVLSSEVRHAIKSVKNRTAPGLDRVKPEHLKNAPPVT